MNLKSILISRPEYQKPLYTKVLGNNGKNYYYNANPFSVWVEDGEGCSGRTVTYEMLKGDTEVVKGPWNTNAHDLLKQTGVDITQNFFSFGLVIEREDIEKFKNGEEIEPVISDKDWTKGSYEGGVERMRELVLDIGLEYSSNLVIAFINCNGTLSFTGIK